MNSSTLSWLSELEMDNSMFMDDQYNFIDSFDEDLTALAFEQGFQNCVSHGSNSSSPSALINTPNNNSFDSFFTSDPFALNFVNKNPFENVQQVNPRPLNPEKKDVANEVMISSGSSNVNVNEGKKKAAQSTKKKTRVRPPSQTYDHIIAERKRREQLSQLFVSLSAIVPGLKKMDKSSVLEDAIKYLKHLKERVNNLEEQAENQAMESHVVMVRRSRIVVEDEGYSDEISGGSEKQPLPEMAARVCNNHMLVRIHCEKQKGVLVKLLSKVESLNMSVVSTNATLLGDVALDITIFTEMEKEFNLTVKEVLIDLRAALQRAA